jgi:1-deoxy-D-xylulose-5-phosphate reductoisomerase
METGGTAACVLNAANEITVAAFLEKKIGFFDIAAINQKTMNLISSKNNPNLNDYIAFDNEARNVASSLIL